ncbi:M20 family metallopeptidase [Pontibacillus salicampi]|uniref:M20 family metallopeptidase n=1 Tax=Pontibacillus salicampi TaxID=1449801 RepID=A0ABV6LPK8_9BACI
MIDSLFNQHIESIQDDIIFMRRHLHQYPELSNEEYQTSAYIKEKLTQYGVEWQDGFAKTGVLGIIRGNNPGKTVALRADIDALPIQETNDHAFISKHSGIMHACGHDAHTAMLIGTGYALQQMKEHIAGTVLLVFQPAEENSPIGGSKPMMEDGVFSTYTPDVIYGQHVWPSLSVGEIGIIDKEMMGASDRFCVEISGSGGHASMPQEGNDAIIIANQVISALQTIVSRNINPLDAAVVTIGRIEGGYRYNVIPDKVTVEGTIRTFKPEVKKKVKERFFTIIEQTVAAFNGTASIDYLDGYPATINTPEWAQQARDTAQRMMSPSSTPYVEPVLAGEDFARYLEQYQGAFLWLGTRLENQEEQRALHDSGFQINETALPIGSAFMAQLAFDTLHTLHHYSKEE